MRRPGRRTVAEGCGSASSGPASASSSSCSTSSCCPSAERLPHAGRGDGAVAFGNRSISRFDPITFTSPRRPSHHPAPGRDDSVVVVSSVVAAIFGQQYTFTTDANGFPTGFSTNFVSATVTLLLSLVVSAVYWIYTWTAMRGSPGMKALGMQVGNYPDGATLTQNQAVRRWIALGGLLPLVQVLYQLPAIGALIGLATLGYYAYLLYSTAKSPTKQGFHDKYANSVVVKAARVA